MIAAVHVSLRARWPRGALQEFQSLVASSALHLLLEFIKGEEGRTLLSRYAGKQLSTHIDLRELQQRLNSFETEGHALTDTLPPEKPQGSLILGGPSVWLQNRDCA